MPKKITTVNYVTADGTKFDTEKQAIAYEELMRYAKKIQLFEAEFIDPPDTDVYDLTDRLAIELERADNVSALRETALIIDRRDEVIAFLQSLPPVKRISSKIQKKLSKRQ